MPNETGAKRGKEMDKKERRKGNSSTEQQNQTEATEENWDDELSNPHGQSKAAESLLSPPWTSQAGNNHEDTTKVIQNTLIN